MTLTYIWKGVLYVVMSEGNMTWIEWIVNWEGCDFCTSSCVFYICGINTKLKKQNKTKQNKTKQNKFDQETVRIKDGMVEIRRERCVSRNTWWSCPWCLCTLTGGIPATADIFSLISLFGLIYILLHSMWN